MQGDDESSEEAFDDAAAIAQREGDQQLELQVLTNSGLVDSSAGRSGPDVIRRAERVVDFASRLGDVSTEFRSREWAALNFLREGLPNQAREHLEACEEIAERLDYLPFRIDIFRLASVIEMCRGNMDGVRHAIEQFPVAINFALPRARQIEVELITGEIESASGKLRQLIRDVQRGVTRDARSPVAGEMAALVSLSGFASRLGVEDAPVDTVQRISERVLSGAAPPVPTLVAHFGNAMLGGYEEDEAALGDLLVGISPFKGKFSVPYPHVDRILGTLEAMSGNHDAAQALFKSSMSFAESANYPLEVAMTCLDEATAAIRHNSNADRKRVEALISKGVAISDANGLFGVVKQFDAIRDGAAQLGQTRPTYPDGLSSREVEVLVELAKGKLNREIGESLFITENTVIRHVSNIFTKTGVANRGEAGAYAVRQGIAGEVEESK
jgi:DNA-binding CsgD family transcriptional regulator